jgi:hypothetical protein
MRRWTGGAPSRPPLPHPTCREIRTRLALDRCANCDAGRRPWSHLLHRQLRKRNGGTWIRLPYPLIQNYRVCCLTLLVSVRSIAGVWSATRPVSPSASLCRARSHLRWGTCSGLPMDRGRPGSYSLADAPRVGETDTPESARKRLATFSDPLSCSRFSSSRLPSTARSAPRHVCLGGRVTTFW